MAEPRNAPMRIGHLNLRISGRTPEFGRRVSEGVGHHLGDRLSPGRARRIGTVSLRVEVPAGATEAEISHAIANSILRTLGRGGQADGGTRESRAWRSR